MELSIENKIHKLDRGSPVYNRHSKQENGENVEKMELSIENKICKLDQESLISNRHSK